MSWAWLTVLVLIMSYDRNNKLENKGRSAGLQILRKEQI